MKKLVFALIMLFSASAFADLPRIAVYVTGDVPENERTALGTVMLSSFINSGRYRGIERSTAFIAEIEREQVTQRSGAIDDSQISELGRQFGVKYVCIAAITPAFGEFQVSARIVDVETAEVVFIGQAFSPLRTPDDLTQVSEQVVNIMFRGQAAPQVAPAPVTPVAPVAQPTPVQPLAPRTAKNVMEDGHRRVDPIPPAPASPSKPATFWAAIGLDVVGAGLIAYGVIENGNVGPYTDKDEYDKVNKSARTRNIVYGIGAAALLGGISIHIFF